MSAMNVCLNNIIRFNIFSILQTALYLQQNSLHSVPRGKGHNSYQPEIYNFGHHYYYILCLSALCPGVEKKIF